MSEFPEVARRRLSRVAGTGDHPDTGLLTAFVEASLTKRHRDELLAHLSACSECNRLVALITPEREVAGVVQPAEARRRWFAWTPVRWAGMSAAAAVVICAIMIGRIGQPTKVRPAPSPAVQEAPPKLTAQLPAGVTAQPGARPIRKPSRPATHSPAPAPSAVSPQPTLAQADTPIVAPSRPAAPGDVRDQTAFETSMMTDPGAWPELPPAAAAPPPVKTEPASPVPVTGPMWSISDTGALQRSNDGGHTWGAMAVPTRLPLHAVSVSGQDVWTGGDQGALYHSADGGRTWTTVVPTSNGLALSADILRIVFSDVRHGWIATRDRTLWVTRDGGATWSQK